MHDPSRNTMSVGQKRRWRDHRTGHFWDVQLTQSSTPVIVFTRWAERYVDEVWYPIEDLADVNEVQLETLLDGAIRHG